MCCGYLLDEVDRAQNRTGCLIFALFTLDVSASGGSWLIDVCPLSPFCPLLEHQFMTEEEPEQSSSQDAQNIAAQKRILLESLVKILAAQEYAGLCEVTFLNNGAVTKG